MSVESGVVRIPAELAERGELPSHCARHGRPAVRRADFALQSTVHIEGSRARQVGIFGVLGMAERLGQHARKVRVTHVKGWPLCEICARTRTVWLAIAAVLAVGGLLTFAGSLVAGALAEHGTVRSLAAVAMVGFVVMIISAFPYAKGGMARVIGASTAPEGGAVLVDNPSQAFLAELEDRS
ncbi:hypothetical protein SAXI111661_10120 [Saccharomonospora xinjiangensis]|uniref:hypothetical protein n=1 Tax=Saccharomonospora xinjiangensis TaxID=75294 RepID=UPI00106F98CE|nr:hypothetical protein [Saccharomonospora xinjiangensis]QBQ59937.1 hypothetical protein EYD13_07880 [Saccharomonospora xinjiangensis]